MSSSLQELSLATAIKAEELDPPPAEVAKDAIRPSTDTLELSAPTVVASISLRVTRLSRLKLAARLLVLRLKLIKFRLSVIQLELQILVGSLKCRVLGLDEPNVLSKNRRRAVLGDELVKKFENACHVALRDALKVEVVKCSPRAERGKQAISVDVCTFLWLLAATLFTLHHASATWRAGNADSVSPVATAFFTMYAAWSVFFFITLRQIWSAAGAGLLCAAHIVWLVLQIRFCEIAALDFLARFWR